MIEKVEKQKSARWKAVAALFLVSCRISSSFVPVEFLTSPTTPQCEECRRSHPGRKRSRWESRDYSHFAIRVEEEQGINDERVTSSLSYPNGTNESNLYFSKPVTNGQKNGKTITGSNGETGKINQPPRLEDEPNNITQPVKYSVLMQAEELVKKNKATKPQSTMEIDVNEDSNGKNINGTNSSMTIPKNDTNNEKEEQVDKEQSKRGLWSKRNARTLEEGIRRETAPELYSLLNEAQIEARTSQGRRYVERTFMGLINALAAEHEDLDVGITASEKSPIWRKKVKEVRITFTRLGFKPIRMGGNDIEDDKDIPVQLYSLTRSADEAFDQIDKDNSGTLDQEELAEALSMISDLETDKESCQELASKLVALYDFNGDGFVDREEYQKMVEDMAAVSPESTEKTGPLNAAKKSVQTISKGISEKAAQVASVVRRTKDSDKEEEKVPIKEYGSIVLSNLKLDLRRVLFGGFPIIKRVTPGGPLILEPFSVTINGSFTREDVMGSFLLDAGLKLLVARALRVRARSFRDVVGLDLLFGRNYKLNSKSAPVVQVLGLSNIEFDSNDKMVVTGRAKLRTSPTAPVITNTFKVRTKIGTTRNGHSIRLVEPELAFVFECPQAIENGLMTVCEKLGMPAPERPDPIYSFFPIYSPFKMNDNGGFYMGEDNRIRKIFIKDGKLRLEMRTVLKPGRFLGNHYLAFTVPNRSFVITMDRVREGIRAARQNKKIAIREKQLAAKSGDLAEEEEQEEEVSTRKRFRTSLRKGASRLIKKLFSKRSKPVKPKSFFSRFVEGYTLIERENERLTSEISTWFGRQGSIPQNTTAESPGAIEVE